MIDNKSQYRFVAQEAMKHIKVEGLVYPIRPQHLILLGEDRAFLEEALREHEHRAQNNFASTLPDKFTDPILAVWHDEASVYERIKDELHVGNYLDPAKVEEEVPVGQTICTFTAKTGKNPQYLAILEEKALKIEKEADDAYNSRYNQYKQNYDARVRTIKEKLDAEAEALAERIQEAKDKYVEDYNTAKDKSDGNIDKLTRQREKDVKALDGRHASGDLSDDDYQLELGKVNVAYQLSVEKEKVDFIGVKFDLECTRDLTISSLNNAYDRSETVAYEDLERWNEDQLSALEDYRYQVDTNANSEITALAVSGEYRFSKTAVDDIIATFLIIKHNQSYYEHLRSLNRCAITKSCADKFFARKAVFTPSATAMTRLYADLEHMNMRLENSVYLVRKTFTRQWRSEYYPGEIFNEDTIKEYNENGPTGSYDDSIHYVDYDDKGKKFWYCTESSSEFRIYIGDKTLASNIEYIDADAIVWRLNEASGYGGGDDYHIRDRINIEVKRVRFNKTTIKNGYLKQCDALVDAFLRDKATAERECNSDLWTYSHREGVAINEAWSTYYARTEALGAELRQEKQRIQTQFMRSCEQQMTICNAKIQAATEDGDEAAAEAARQEYKAAIASLEAQRESKLQRAYYEHDRMMDNAAANRDNSIRNAENVYSSSFKSRKSSLAKEIRRLTSNCNRDTLAINNEARANDTKCRADQRLCFTYNAQPIGGPWLLKDMYEYDECYIAFRNFTVKYAWPTETGVDFSEYYAELDGGNDNA